jgi:hypothetical protein
VPVTATISSLCTTPTKRVVTIFAVYPSRQYLPPRVRTLIDFMVERFGDNPYWDRGVRSRAHSSCAMNRGLPLEPCSGTMSAQDGWTVLTILNE